MRYPTASLAVPQVVADKLDAAAGVKQPLLFAKTHTDVRLMDGRFQVFAEAMGTFGDHQPDPSVAPPAEN